MDANFLMLRPFSFKERAADQPDDRFANRLSATAQPSIWRAADVLNAFSAAARDYFSFDQTLDVSAGEHAWAGFRLRLNKNPSEQGNESSHGAAALLARLA
jgi:hypothetical protein